ncbi:MAG: hypothetical protein WCP98_02930 [Actinomycetes bacterium]
MVSRSCRPATSSRHARRRPSSRDAGFADGAPTLRLPPIDLRYGARLTESDTPRRADPGAAQAILARLGALSRPFGSIVEMRDGIGHAVPA